MESFKPEERVEQMSQPLDEFITQLEELTGESELQLQETDGTYEIDCDQFNLTFTVDEERFEIRNIDALGNQGVGRSVLSAIHNYADDNELEVIASNVLDTAEGFWQTMGYQPGDTEDEYFRAA